MSNATPSAGDPPADLPAQPDQAEVPPVDSTGEAPQAGGNQPTAGQAILIRYGLMQQIGQFAHTLASPPRPSEYAVIRTERGVELGQVVLNLGEGSADRFIVAQKLKEYLRQCGPEYPLHHGGRVLRMANSQDVIDHRHLRESAREEGAYCRQQIRELNLPMRLVTVEHLLGGERIIFYFSSESRIDFRELVRRLAAQFRTRIEMRQVGARDEARLVGDYERCGQRCCCQQFLKDLKPISMRMAKTQKATLDPSKISGRCGRLMCCLRYEDEVYEELRKKLPRRNTWVRTAEVVGRVVEGQIITQLVRLALPDNTMTVVSVEEILERDVPAPAMQPEPVKPERPERSEPARPTRLLRDESSTGQAQAVQQASSEDLPVVGDGAAVEPCQGTCGHPCQGHPGDEAPGDAEAMSYDTAGDSASDESAGRPGPSQRPEGSRGRRRRHRGRGRKPTGDAQPAGNGSRPPSAPPNAQAKGEPNAQGSERRGGRGRRRGRRGRGRPPGSAGSGQGQAPNAPPSAPPGG